MSTRKSARASTAASKAEPAATPVSETAVVERSTPAATPSKRRATAKATKASAKAAVPSLAPDFEVELKPDVNEEATPPVPASRVVFSTAEIRRRILDLLDKETLVAMMALEKAAVADVSAVLYRTIPAPVVTKISRISPRRETYCQSVQEIDRSPAPDATSSSFVSTLIPPVTLAPGTLLESISSLRLAFPNLRRILYQSPPSVIDDAYVVHLPSSDDPITVEIRSYVRIDIATHPYPSNDLLPSPPKEIPGMVIRHTLLVDVDYTKSTNMNSATAERCRAWLVSNPNLDRRVVEFRLTPDVRKKVILSSDDVISFLTHRRASGSEPVQGLHLTISSGPIARIDEMARLVGPELRTIHLESIVLQHDLPRVIRLLDKAFPYVQHLIFENSPKSMMRMDFSVPLAGLPNLRSFRYGTNWATQRSPPPPIGLARYLCALGRSDCVYMIPMYQLPTVAKQLHDLVRALRFRNPRYAHLETINHNDLDLWEPNDIFAIPSLSQARSVRRNGCSKSASFGYRRLSDQKQLETHFAQHKAVAERFQEIFAGANEELRGTDGNLPAQGDVLRRRFEKVAEQKLALDVAFQAMQRSMISLESSAKEAADYAAKWLAANPKSVAGQGGS